MERIIKRVLINKSNKQLLVAIPKDCGLKPGDYIEITKVPEMKKVRK